MALMAEDVFEENILDEPDVLERVVEGDENTPDFANDSENEGDQEKKDSPDNKKDEKKKRKQSVRPKLNILRLMDKNGLMALEDIFKDVKLKGKGFEFEDLNMIMRKLEIWAHRLFPSLQFDDCLAKLEKLGSNKSVCTYIKKIRLGLEDELPKGDDNVADMDTDGDNNVDDNNVDNVFDQLLGSAKSKQPAFQPTNSDSGLTVEQRERMLKNRMIAEQRRMARLKARQLEQLSNIDSVENCINHERFVNGQSEKMDLGENTGSGARQIFLSSTEKNLANENEEENDQLSSQVQNIDTQSQDIVSVSNLSLNKDMLENSAVSQNDVLICDSNKIPDSENVQSLSQEVFGVDNQVDIISGTSHNFISIPEKKD